MTTTTNNILSKKMLPGILTIIMVFNLYACAKKTTAVSKAEPPPATATVSPIVLPEESKGQVQIKRDVNSNYVIQINLRELEEVKKLEATSKKAYIVWMDADKQTTKNLGQINSNTGWLSDKSKASFEATSVFKPTKIFITEEDNATAMKPGTNIIWSTNRF